MIVFTWVILFLVIVITLAFNRASMAVLTIGLVVYLLLVSTLSHASEVTITILWLLLFIFVASFKFLPLRRRLFSKPILKIYRKLMPTMSVTEKEALAKNNH